MVNRIILILAAAFAGTVAGFYGGAYLFCNVLWPDQNLCGLYAVFGTAPLGMIVGGSVCAWITWPKRPPKA
jgi:hypothetical protein